MSSPALSLTPRNIPSASAGYDDRREAPLRDWQGPQERPITLLLNDTAMVSLLATPESLEPLALGHAFTAGWIDSIDQVHAVQLARLRHGLSVALEVAPSVAARAEAGRRPAASVSSCGACGMVDEAQLMAGLKRLEARPPLPSEALRRGLAELEARARRGQHGALGLEASGSVVMDGWDIGRHNALDRVIGEGLRRGRMPDAVLLSSRCSLELVQKTVRAGITTLATLSLPSAMAVEVARACGLNLICCHRGRRLELISGHAPDEEPRS
ncbi:formate dehydrogenase accessory sulfurtransferase FdhD [Halomonas sp. YLGW01]|uniref:formate dehydrogenase accessory sulfurtransferase FdhD n=1 Tax=Halomonas sp. YLGW01 TaxID=2773308 RepID=UPI001783C6A4|nr:formate dehydrogenase accessory sulfurtransferase FdhD [Halomonas sp. YLGW01]